LGVGLNQWLALMEALDRGLHRSSLDTFYNISRSLLVTGEADFDAFDRAFYACFKGGEKEAVTLSKQALEWLENPAAMIDRLSPQQRAFLEHVDLDALRRMFAERLAAQTERHDGGNRWVGTGGTSPFGWGGAHPGGIRVAGRGQNRTAVQIAAARRYRAYRRDLLLDVRQIGVALRKLRELTREGADEELDLEATIDQTCRNAGELELVYRPRRRNNVRVLLLMDVGGSMTPHARTVSRLFSAAHSANHFRDFRYFYFHNCVYENVYESARFTHPMRVADLLHTFSSRYKLVVVGDASMHPAELLRPGGAIHYWEMNWRPGVEWLQDLADHFERRVWLNPDPERYWQHATVRMIRKLFPMYPLTLQGLDGAVIRLVGGKTGNLATCC
jgi:hypothetical protein